MGRIDVTLNIFYENKKQNEKQENIGMKTHVIAHPFIKVISAIPGRKALHTKSTKTRQSITGSISIT